MEITTQIQGGTLIASVVSTRIDAACAVQFKDRMRAILEDAQGAIVLDLGAVDFVDSSGLGAIVAVMKLVDGGRKMVLASLTPTVQRLFGLTRLDSVFEIRADIEQAIDFERQAS